MKIPTGLRGFAASSRNAITALILKFGNSDFSFREAIELCQISVKEFAKLRVDGIIVKVGKGYPAHWRISQRYLPMWELHTPPKEK
ncbi:MAG: hypothetical protein LUQ31_01255 [Methanoregula sp.]|nr:hypothetical protein [Methanoregula sp.]